MIFHKNLHLITTNYYINLNVYECYFISLQILTAIGIFGPDLSLRNVADLVASWGQSLILLTALQKKAKKTKNKKQKPITFIKERKVPISLSPKIKTKMHFSSTSSRDILTIHLSFTQMLSYYDS